MLRESWREMLPVSPGLYTCFVKKYSVVTKMFVVQLVLSLLDYAMQLPDNT